MKKNLCIHGHFYQPPREDPWLHEILPEASAGPGRHWNERISKECYAPMAWARRLDDSGRITELLNCYEWISFNFGPTLLNWLERHDSTTYERLLEGDAASVKRWGHGNALAQIYHHVIMPLATPLEKRVEVAWAKADFQARFGRDPEGIWLSETAVDIPTLEAVAEAGFTFTLLAPRQAAAVADIGGDTWQGVNEHEIDIRQPYAVELPSGKTFSVFFYHGDISQAVAFERLLENGDHFFNRMAGFFHGQHEGPKGSDSSLLTLGTDGETYGHHFKFGEMALAYALAQAREGREDIELTNLAAYLANNPPRQKVRIHEPSSWSCVHGVQRWCADCGCSTGEHGHYNQCWRAPFREALDAVKQDVDSHYFAKGNALFKDAEHALLDYGHVLAGTQAQEAFVKTHFKARLSAAKHRVAWKLLAMQQWALASYASCAWFFDEISRIEPLNGLTFALRAMELAADTGGPTLEALEKKLTNKLAGAQSNNPELGTGRDLFYAQVKPRQESSASLAGQAVLSTWIHNTLDDSTLKAPARASWPGVSVDVVQHKSTDAVLSGELAVHWHLEHGEVRYAWEWRREDACAPLDGEVVVKQKGASKETSLCDMKNLAWNKRQALALQYVEHAQAIDWQAREKNLSVSAGFYLPWQAYQYAQNSEPSWTFFWPGLMITYVLGDAPLLPDEQEQDLLAFLKKTGDSHPDRETVAGHVGKHILKQLASPELDKNVAEALEVLVLRARQAACPVDWWLVQNRLWELRQEWDHVPGLVRAAGFKL